MDNDDRREYQRIDAFWKLYRDDYLWGYLLNMSKVGMKVWLDKENEMSGDTFMVQIRLPSEFELESVSFKVQCVWVIKSKTSIFNEIGCRLLDITPEQKEVIDQLFEFFNKLNAVDKKV